MAGNFLIIQQMMQSILFASVTNSRNVSPLIAVLVSRVFRCAVMSIKYTLRYVHTASQNVCPLQCLRVVVTNVHFI
jgi:hypothetical protein